MSVCTTFVRSGAAFYTFHFGAVHNPVATPGTGGGMPAPKPKSADAIFGAPPPGYVRAIAGRAECFATQRRCGVVHIWQGTSRWTVNASRCAGLGAGSWSWRDGFHWRCES